MKFLFAYLLLCFLSGDVCSAVPHTPAEIRDSLFRCKYLLHQAHTPIHASILKKISLSKADSKTIPSLALVKVTSLNSSSKTDRETFIKSIASVIKCVNKEIMEQRKLVVLVKNKGLFELSSAQKDRFAMICAFYQTRNINELLKRVAPVPVSLATAQAALESGFGGNDFIQNNNAYFGMMKNSKQLLSFNTLFESAIAYSKTLNVHPYYRSFRNERSKMLNSSKKVDGSKLCAYIGKYCVKRDYRKKVTTLINEYNLTALDQAYQLDT